MAALAATAGTVLTLVPLVAIYVIAVELLADGTLVEYGRHQDLLARRDGLYASLWAADGGDAQGLPA